MSLRSVHSSTLTASHSESSSSDSKEVSISYADCLVENLEKLKILKSHLLSTIKNIHAKEIASVQACQVFSFDINQDKQLLINIGRIEVMELQLLIQDIKKQLLLLRSEEYEFTRGYVDYLIHQYKLALKKILIQYLRMNTKIMSELADFLSNRSTFSFFSSFSSNIPKESLELKLLLETPPKQLNDNEALLLANLAADGPAIMTLIEWGNANPFAELFYKTDPLSCPLGFGSNITSKLFDFQFKQFYFQHPHVKSLREKLYFLPRDLQELILNYLYIDAYDLVSSDNVKTLRLTAEMTHNSTFKMQLYDLYLNVERRRIANSIPEENKIILAHFDEEFNRKFASSSDSSPPTSGLMTTTQKSDPCNAFGSTLLMIHTKIYNWGKLPELLKTSNPFQEDRRGYSTFAWAIKVRHYDLFKHIIEMYSIGHHIDCNRGVILDDRKQIAHIKKVAMNASDTLLFTELFGRTSLSLDEYCRLGIPDKETVSAAAPISDRFLKERDIIQEYLNDLAMEQPYDKAALALLFLKGRISFFELGNRRNSERHERTVGILNSLFCCKTDENRLETFLHCIHRLDNLGFSRISSYRWYLMYSLPTLFLNQPSNIIIPVLAAFKEFCERILFGPIEFADKESSLNKSIESLLKAKKYDVLFYLLHNNYKDKEKFSALARKIKSECEGIFKFQSHLSFFSNKPIAPPQVELIIQLAEDKLKTCVPNKSP